MAATTASSAGLGADCLDRRSRQGRLRVQLDQRFGTRPIRLHQQRQLQLGIAGQGLRDIITDFTHGQDKIDLSAIDANTRVAGNQAFTWRGTGDFTRPRRAS